MLRSQNNITIETSAHFDNPFPPICVSLVACCWAFLAAPHLPFPCTRRGVEPCCRQQHLPSMVTRPLNRTRVGRSWVHGMRPPQPMPILLGPCSAVGELWNKRCAALVSQAVPSCSHARFCMWCPGLSWPPVLRRPCMLAHCLMRFSAIACAVRFLCSFLLFDAILSKRMCCALPCSFSDSHDISLDSPERLQVESDR